MAQDFESFDDLLMDESDDGTNQFDAKEIQTLKEQLAAIEKEKQGLLKGVQEERRKRQEMKGRLDQVTTTVNSILEQREALAQSQTQKDEDTIEGIGLIMNEDGEYVLPKKALDDVITPYQQKIEELEQELAMTKTDVQSNREYDNAVAAMVGEKPEYDPAYRQYKTARKWVSDQVANWSYNNGVQRTLNSGEALSYAIDENVVNEFNERFPGMDITTVVTAEDSPWHFKTMLQKTAETLDSFEPAPKDSRFRKVMQKPSSLGKSANARGGEDSITEKVSGLSSLDIMNLDDKQIDALARFMREDEEKDGIDW